MNRNELNKALKRGVNAKSKLSKACSDMATFFEPYFDCEIEVLHQMGDGFVILYNIDRHDNQANLNEPVISAFENIRKNKDYYR